MIFFYIPDLFTHIPYQMMFVSFNSNTTGVMWSRNCYPFRNTWVHSQFL